MLYTGERIDAQEAYRLGLVNRVVSQSDLTDGTLTIGGNGIEGDIVIRDSAGRDALRCNGETGQLYLGSDGVEGDLVVRDESGIDRIVLNGSTGDIELMGADLAEEFACGNDLSPGTVVVARGADEVEAAHGANDRRVVGVVSGGGGFNTALRLGAGRGGQRVAVALVGRVYRHADAASGPIAIGDLLVTGTSSGTPCGRPTIQRRAPSSARRWDLSTMAADSCRCCSCRGER